MTRPFGARPGLTRLAFAGASVVSAAAGLLLASNHPLWPGAMSSLFCAWALVSYWRPGLWLVALPTALPLLGLSPWTGWLVFDEFDLAILSTVAAEFARFAVRGPPTPIVPSRATTTALALACLGLLGLGRGLDDAGGWSFGLFQSYTDPMNSVRVFKPMLYMVLFLPFVHPILRDAESAQLAIKRLSGGMLLGLGVVTLAVLWERAAHPGLLDFSAPYRTVALFWEMHVGGAAIDAYLALASPFVAWRLCSSRSPLQWGTAAVLALLTEYICLTTFSRGVYLAVIGPLVLLGLLLRRHARGRAPALPGRRTRAICVMLLATLMLLEAALVLGSGTLMVSRMGSSEQDFRSRLAHWQNGLSLLHTPGDWAFGIGLGRLPSRYAAAVPGGELPGQVALRGEPRQGYVRIFGPRSLASLGGRYGLTQRVPIQTSESLLVRFNARSVRATRLRLSVCEMHLLYERNCQAAAVTAQATGTDWQPLSARLVGPPLTVGHWYAPRMGVFSLTVLDAGGTVDLDNVSLQGANRVEQLFNGEFTQQLSHWFALAKNHFLPWHIDNLYLEMIIERGLCGLVVFMLLIGLATWNLCFGPGRQQEIAPFLVASLAGAMTVGLVSSIMDAPRVAFLLLLLAIFSMCVHADGQATP